MRTRFLHEMATNHQTNNKLNGPNKYQTNNKQQTTQNKRTYNKRRFRLDGESDVTERKRFFMKSTKPNGPDEIGQSLEKEIAGNVRALPRVTGALQRSENGTGETSGDNLGTLLRRVSEA